MIDGQLSIAVVLALVLVLLARRWLAMKRIQAHEEAPSNESQQASRAVQRQRVEIERLPQDNNASDDGSGFAVSAAVAIAVIIVA